MLAVVAFRPWSFHKAGTSMVEVPHACMRLVDAPVGRQQLAAGNCLSALVSLACSRVLLMLEGFNVAPQLAMYAMYATCSMAVSVTTVDLRHRARR